jgi:hypothetical protein
MLVRDQIKIWYDGKIVDNNYGFVYLDGDHEENTVATEISYFLPKLCNNGLLVIDDYNYIIDSSNEVIKDVIKNSIQRGNRLYFENKCN